jgi:hypothetical protein
VLIISGSGYAIAKSILNNTMKVSPLFLSNKSILLMVVIVISILILDTALEKITDLIGESETSPSNIRISLFVVISVIGYGIGQYLILSFVNRKTKGMRSGNKIITDTSAADYAQNSNMERSSYIRRTTRGGRRGGSSIFFSQIRGVLIVQLILTAILVVIIWLMVFASHYYTILLTASTIISYGLAIALTGLLAKSFFKWFKSNRNSVVLSYGLASAIVALNLIVSCVFMTAILLSKPTEVIEHLTTIWPALDPSSPMGMLNSAYVLSGIFAFMSMWISTALLLRHYSKKLGKVKYWTIISIPLAYFLSQFALPLFLDQMLAPMLNSNPIFIGTVFTLIFSISKPAGGILFGAAFWAMAKAISRNNGVVRDYMIISALGVVLLFVSTQGSVISATYPPFGLVTVSFVAFSSYMMFTGLYSAALSVSADIKLRKIIRKQVMQEVRLLGSIGTAEMEQQLQRKVFKVTRENSAALEESYGVKSSLSQDEIKDYLQIVISETKGYSRNKSPDT